MKPHITRQIQTLAQELHKGWLADFKAGGGTERFKPIPNSDTWSKDERTDILKKDPTTRLGTNKEGVEVVEQNIVQAPKNIHPALAALNGKLAEEYFKALDKFVGKRERAAEIVHEIWMRENSWQKENNPGLFVRYDQLPEVEKEKDRAVVRVLENLKEQEIIVEI